jgi:uncharacterized DUF497 family protein
MHLEYDPAKNAANVRKHGIDFDDAGLVLFDFRALVLKTRKPKESNGLWPSALTLWVAS